MGKRGTIGKQEEKSSGKEIIRKMRLDMDGKEGREVE